MIEVTVVFGKDASNYYDETGSLKKTQAYINRGGDGMIVKKKFNTQAECDEYFAGIDDMDGWLGYTVAE